MQPLDKATATFTYTRRDPALSGWAYVIETAPDLKTWTVDTGSVQDVLSTEGDVQTVQVTLTGPLPDAIFVRVEGTAAP